MDGSFFFSVPHFKTVGISVTGIRHFRLAFATTMNFRQIKHPFFPQGGTMSSRPFRRTKRAAICTEAHCCDHRDRENVDDKRAPASLAEESVVYLVVFLFSYSENLEHGVLEGTLYSSKQYFQTHEYRFFSFILFILLVVSCGRERELILGRGVRKLTIHAAKNRFAWIELEL